MLRDGDVVAVAHLELTFLDGRSERATGQALRRLGLMAAALIVAVLIYSGYGLIHASAVHLRDEAYSMSEEGRFQEARVRLADAVHRRGYGAIRASAVELLVDLERWESTLKEWEDAKRALEAEKWSDALSRLDVAVKGDWSWGADGYRKKRECGEARAWLALALEAAQKMKEGDTSPEILTACRASLSKALENAQGCVGERAYARRLIAFMEEMARGIQEAIRTRGVSDEKLGR